MPRRNILSNAHSFFQRIILQGESLEDFGGEINTKVFDTNTKTEYLLVKDTTLPINGTSVRNTIYRGDTRWVGISGQYNYYSISSADPMIIQLDGDFFTNDKYIIPKVYGQRYILNPGTYVGNLQLPTNMGQNAGRYVEFLIISNNANEYNIYDEDENIVYSFLSTVFVLVRISSTGIATLGKRWIVEIEEDYNYPSSITLNNLKAKGTVSFTGGISRSQILSVQTSQILSVDTNTYICTNNNDITLTLPLISGYGLGQIFRIEKSANFGNVTIVPNNGTQRINGKTNIVLTTPGQYIELINTDGNWSILSTNLETEKALTTASYSASATINPWVTLATVNSSSDITLTLPSLTDLKIGHFIYIKNSSAYKVTITANTGDTIDATTSIVLSNQYDYITLTKQQSNVWGFTSKSKDVYYGTGDPPNPTGLPDGSIFIQYIP
jgi:hypothetical protein